MHRRAHYRPLGALKAAHGSRLRNAIRVLDAAGYTVQPSAGCWHVARANGTTAGILGREALIAFAAGLSE